MILQDIRFLPEIPAPPSKSEAIRALILCALGTRTADIVLSSSCEDIDVCAAAVRALGAKAVRTETGYTVIPQYYNIATDRYIPDFADCATALRLMAPVYRALTGGKLSYTASPRLCARAAAAGDLYGTVLLDGSVSADTSLSSQTASGELIALSLRGGTLHLSGDCVSRPYLDLTAALLKAFGASVSCPDSRTLSLLPAKLCAPEHSLRIDSDASAMAYLLVAGAIGSQPVTVTEVFSASPQGDTAILNILRGCGAKMKENRNQITVFPSALSPFAVDVKDTPDLVMPLCAAACACAEQCTFSNLERLRFKESDRVAEICAAVSALGGSAVYTDGTLSVHGPLRGGVLPHTDDHRIAMMGVLLSLLCRDPVTTDSLGCTGKSYPDFPNTFRRNP